MDREDARVVLHAALQQLVERPHGRAEDGEARRPVANRPLPDAPLERLRGALHILAELDGGQCVESAMEVAVGGDLVTVGGDPLDDVAVTCGHPAEHEEGGMDSPACEQPQEAVDRIVDPRVTAAPAGLIDPQVVRVEPALDVDREQGRVSGTHCSCSDRSGGAGTAVAGATGRQRETR